MNNFRKNLVQTIKNLPRNFINGVKEESTYFCKSYFIDKILDATVVLFVISLLFPLVTSLVGTGIIALVLKVLAVSIALYLADVTRSATDTER